MAQLHFSNLAPSSEKATLLSITGDDHKFSRNETMKSHADHYGNTDKWNYFFSLVIITDKNKEELKYLLEDHTFTEPEFDTDEYWVMRNTGQISLTFSNFEKYMRLS